VNAAVIRAALESYPGRAVVNSVNLENGRTRCDSVLPLVHDHGACVIALTIDEQGMANTAERKLAVATRIRDLACTEFRLQPDQLLFDALTFTLATGEAEYIDSARQTIEGIRRIKESLPGVLTVLGVSNVSFGLSVASRPALNSVFLYHCVQAGLDAAIVNPAHITPYAEIGATERELAEDLIFNRREDALARFIGHFDGAVAAIDSSSNPFEGMEPAAGGRLIEELTSAATAPGLSYQHKWRNGDVIMWDNRATMHRGRPWPAHEARFMVRTTISATAADGVETMRSPSLQAAE
jgi:5-methyltetrahydrofolate--homocysteine methyltransferase